MEFTFYSALQAVRFLGCFSGRSFRQYEDAELSKLVELVAKTILRIMFKNSSTGWNNYEQSNGSNHYAAVNTHEFIADHGHDDYGVCNWVTWVNGAGDVAYNKGNYELIVRPCNRTTRTLGNFVGVVAHEVAHEISGITFEQLIVNGNDHDQIWNDFLVEIYRRLRLLGVPVVNCFIGRNLAVKNHP